MEQFWQREEENVKLWMLNEVNQFVHSLFGRLRAKYENGLSQLNGNAKFLKQDTQSHLQDLAGAALQMAQFGHQHQFDATTFAASTSNQSQEQQQQQHSNENNNYGSLIDVEQFENPNIECDCSVFEGTMIKSDNSNQMINGQMNSTIVNNNIASNRRSVKRGHTRSEDDSNRQVGNEVVVTECLKCPFCVFWFRNKESLDQHMLSAHKIEKFRCAQNGCGQSYASSKMLGAHLREAHRHTKWSCGQCTTTNEYKDHKSLQTHMLNHHYLGTFKCAFTNCDQSANYRAAVRQHYFSAHRNYTLITNDLTKQLMSNNNNMNKKNTSKKKLRYNAENHHISLNYQGNSTKRGSRSK